MKEIVQIAGILDRAEAEMLIDAGADWLGFPLRLQHHAEDLSDREAAEIIHSLPKGDSAVLITYLSDAEDILTLCRQLGCVRVQLHGEIATEEVRKLRNAAPDLFVIKSLIVKRGNHRELREAVMSWTPFVDAFITDTFDPHTGAYGATGKSHDWQISRRLVEQSSKPVILAGGLKPDNIRSAIETVKPAGVDAHTGLENADGSKNETLVRQFVTEARRAFAVL